MTKITTLTYIIHIFLFQTPAQESPIFNPFWTLAKRQVIISSEQNPNKRFSEREREREQLAKGQKDWLSQKGKAIGAQPMPSWGAYRIFQIGLWCASLQRATIQAGSHAIPI